MLPLPNSNIEQPREDESAEFSWEGMALEAGLTGAIQGGIGLAGGGPIGGLAGFVGGAIEGALGYLAGTAAAKLAYTMGASKETQLITSLAVSLAVPTGFIGKSTKIVRELPNLMKESLKMSATAAAAGYIGWSISDEDPRLGIILGAISGAALHGITSLYDMDKVTKHLAARATTFTTKIPGLALLREVPEVFVEPTKWADVAGLPRELSKEVPLGVRDIVKEGLRIGIAKQWEAQMAVKQAEEAGLVAFGKKSRMITEELKYGTSYRAFEEFKKANPEIGEFLDTYIDIVTADTSFLQAAGLLDNDVLSAFTYVNKDLDKLKVHVPIVMKQDAEIGELRYVFKKPTTRLIKEQSLLKESGRRAKVTQKVLDDLGLKEHELIPGQEYEFGGHKWTFVQKDKSRYFLRNYTPEELKAITEKKIAEGIVPEGTVVAPDIVAGAIKIASERSNLYKRAWIVNKLERRLSQFGLLGEKPTSELSVKIPNVKLHDSWGIKAFGRMGGLYTTPEVAKALENINALLDYAPGNFAENLLGDFTRRWTSLTNFGKKFFLGANWKSYLTQGLGNIALCLVNGENPGEVVRKGLKALQDKGFRQAFERIGGESIGVEHDVIIKGYKYASGKLTPRSKIEGAFATLDALGDKLIGYFGYTDKVFRAGLVKKYMEEGLTMNQALTKASEVMPTYEMIPAGIKSLRDTIFPFISFSYVTLPRLVGAVLKNPVNFVSLLALAEGIQVAAFKEMYGERWREGRKFEKLVNENYMQPMPGAFLADYIRIPKMGRIPGGYMSLSWLPWNLPVSVPAVTEATRPTFWGATFFLQHPLLKTVFGLLMNLDPATGRTVFDMAGPGRTWASVTQWVLRNLMPTVVGTGHYGLQMLAKEGWLKPLTSWFNCFGVDYAGQPYELEHLLWNQILPTIKRYDPTYKAGVEIMRIKNSIEEHKRGLYKLAYRGASADVLQQRVKDYQEFANEELKKAREIYTLRGQLGF